MRVRFVFVLFTALAAVAACVAIERPAAPTAIAPAAATESGTAAKGLTPYPPPPPTWTPGPSPTPWDVKPTPIPPPTNPPGPAAAQVVTATFALSPALPGNPVVAAAFLDEQHGWIATVSYDSPPDGASAILETEDGGQTWSVRAILNTHITQLEFPAPERGWAVTADGALLASTDRGGAWTPVVAGDLDTVTQVDFLDAGHGWVVGWPAGNLEPQTSALRRTTDGGHSWQAAAIPDGWQWDGLGVRFASSDTGWALRGNGMGCYQAGQFPSKLWKSTDGGDSWHEVIDPRFVPVMTTPYPFATLPPAPWDQQLPGLCLSGFDFYDDLHGWITDGIRGLSTTDDGGLTWQRPQFSPRFPGPPQQEIRLGAPRLVGPGVGLVGALNVRALLRVNVADGIAHWQRLYPQAIPGGLVQVFDTGEAIGLTDDDDAGAVFTTGDAGAHWRRMTSLPGLQPGAVRFSASFVDRRTGWVLAANDNDSQLYGTHDGGETWAVLSQQAWPHTLSSIAYVTDNVGYAGAVDGELLATTDGGATFGAVEGSSAPGTVYDFATVADGWKLWQGQLSATRDGGHTWSPLPLGYTVTGFDLVPSGQGWVIALDCGTQDCRRLLLRTDDDGRSWQGYVLSSSGFRDDPMVWIGPMGDWQSVAFPSFGASDGAHAWLFSSGHWFATPDGGATWQQVR